MADKFVVYSKPSGEPRVPVTIRIDWLPDGTIKPRMYWTPDGTCYKVISLIESVPLAFLKDGGKGLRFKVTGEIIETPDMDDSILLTRHDTYLYLTDNRYHQKNIIDGRYGHAGKEYISVTLDIFSDGDYELVYFWVHGARYMVEHTTDVKPRGSFHAGGVGLWHKVDARMVGAEDDENPDSQKSIRRSAALFLELNKWFIIRKSE